MAGVPNEIRIRDLRKMDNDLYADFTHRLLLPNLTAAKSHTYSHALLPLRQEIRRRTGGLGYERVYQMLLALLKIVKLMKMMLEDAAIADKSDLWKNVVLYVLDHLRVAFTPEMIERASTEARIGDALKYDTDPEPGSRPPTPLPPPLPPSLPPTPPRPPSPEDPQPLRTAYISSLLNGRGKGKLRGGQLTEFARRHKEAIRVLSLLLIPGAAVAIEEPIRRYTDIPTLGAVVISTLGATAAVFGLSFLYKALDRLGVPAADAEEVVREAGEVIAAVNPAREAVNALRRPMEPIRVPIAPPRRAPPPPRVPEIELVEVEAVREPLPRQARPQSQMRDIVALAEAPRPRVQSLREVIIPDEDEEFMVVDIRPAAEERMGFPPTPARTPLEQERLESLLTGSGMPKKWIQDVVGSPKFKKGAFTKQALKEQETPLEFAQDVLAHPEHFSLKTRRRAQFLHNIQQRKRGGWHYGPMGERLPDPGDKYEGWEWVDDVGKWIDDVAPWISKYGWDLLSMGAPGGFGPGGHYKPDVGQLKPKKGKGTRGGWHYGPMGERLPDPGDKYEGWEWVDDVGKWIDDVAPWISKYGWDLLSMGAPGGFGPGGHYKPDVGQLKPKKGRGTPRQRKKEASDQMSELVKMLGV